MGHLFQETPPIPHHAVYKPMPPRIERESKIGTHVQPKPPILSHMSHPVDKLPHLLSTIRAQIQASQRHANDPSAKRRAKRRGNELYHLMQPGQTK